MAAGMRLILAVASVAVLAGQTAANQKCGYATWGRKNINGLNVQPLRTIPAGNYKTIVNFNNGSYGCRVVGAEAIACTDQEEPLVSFTDDDHVVVRRMLTADKASLQIITFCEAVYPGNYRPGMAIAIQQMQSSGHKIKH